MHILVVDDIMINRTFTARLLEKKGHRVELAGNAIEALHLMENDEYDLVLMDIQMPMMTGLDATRIIREGGRDLPIIALTADIGEETRRQCLASGMNAYLAKPLQEDDIASLASYDRSADAALSGAHPGPSRM